MKITTTEILLFLLLVLFVWSNRNRVPPEYQFWRNNQTWVKVQNSSDRDLTEESVVVWGVPHKLGTIKKGAAQEVKAVRRHEITEVVVRFRYDNELIERHAGTLDEDDEYKMLITVNYAGVVTVLTGADIAGAAATSQ